MCLVHWITKLGLFAVGAYASDVVIRPHLVAKIARREADRRGKPLLNVGAGTPGSSLRARLLGPTLWGDVNSDIAAPRGAPCGRTTVCYGDVQDLSQYRDKTFGAAIASHVLEHVPDPQRALAELVRVADVAYIITPPWWAPHTWLHPGHLWFHRKSDGRFLRLRG